MVGGLQIKIQCLRCGGIAARGVGSEQLTVANTPNEQDPLAKRKINCHRTDVSVRVYGECVTNRYLKRTRRRPGGEHGL